MKGDTIYNGAMDDASGVAAVLDIAHQLKTGPKPKRSILFLFFTAEEKGLLGSSYYARRPTVPKKDIRRRPELRHAAAAVAAQDGLCAGTG